LEVGFAHDSKMYETIKRAAVKPLEDPERYLTEAPRPGTMD
jgi:hypothetical protein